MKNQVTPRVLVIGLDGVPLSLVQALSAAGEMPTLKELIDNGVSGTLKSTFPPTSGPAWATFQTGKNPAKTHIYDFLYRNENAYSFTPISAKRIVGDTIWQIINRAGYKVGVINMPVTYPVDQVDGYMISGFMTPVTGRNYAHPKSLIDELRQAVGPYHIYPRVTYSRGRLIPFLDAGKALLDLRTRSALHLMEHHPVDVMALVYFDPDRVLHQLWHLMDPEHPWPLANGDESEAIHTYFRYLDDCIARLLERVSEDTLVIIMSDHGMGTARNFVVLNNWLLQTGLMRFRNSRSTKFRRILFERGFTLRNLHQAITKLGLARHAEYTFGYYAEKFIRLAFLSFLDVDWTETVAYSFGRHLGGIYLNVKGREPNGIVESGAEYDKMRDRVIELARVFVDPRDGSSLIGRVARREELYHGPYLVEAPDLILFPARQTDVFFGLSDFGSNRTIDTVYRYSGMHRQDGMLILHGPKVKFKGKIEGASITDLAPSILHALNVPIPQDMDGKVLRSLCDDGRVWTGAPSSASDAMVSNDMAVYDKQDEEELIDRLRRLGYLGD